MRLRRRKLRAGALRALWPGVIHHVRSTEAVDVIRVPAAERCPSGRRGRPAKALYGLPRIEGSNPSLSAKTFARRAVSPVETGFEPGGFEWQRPAALNKAKLAFA